jgi:hypothetical protein
MDPMTEGPNESIHPGHPGAQSTASSARTAAANLPRRKDVSSDPAARRRRRRMRRIRTALWAAGGVCLVILACAFWAFEIQGLRGAANSGQQRYSANLSGAATGWVNSGGCGMRDGAYHIAPLGSSGGLSCFAPEGGYRDLDLQVTARVVVPSADGMYGLVFRAPDTADGYLFALDDSTSVAFVGVVSTGEISQLSPLWRIASPDAAGTGHAIKATPTTTTASAGSPHTLEVRAQGGTLNCYVDGTLVGTLSDTRYTQGDVGLYGTAGGHDVAFTDFSVTPLS